METTDATAEQEDKAEEFVANSPVAVLFDVSYEEALSYVIQFEKYDTDCSGDISMKELIPILQTLGLEPKNVAEQCKLKNKINELDDGDGCLNFDEFVTLLKSFQKDAVRDMEMQLEIATEVTGFSQDEVKQLRKVFREFSHVGANQGERSGFMTVTNVRALLLLMGTRLDSEQTQQLDRMMRPLMVTDLGNICALEFPAFLVLIKEIITQDFCGVVKQATQVVKLHVEEQERIRYLSEKIQQDAKKRQKIMTKYIDAISSDSDESSDEDEEEVHHSVPEGGIETAAAKAWNLIREISHEGGLTRTSIAAEGNVKSAILAFGHKEGG